VETAPIQPDQTAKNETGEYDRFTNFLRRLVAVPHSEIKTQLAKEKKKKRKAKLASASRAAAGSSKTG
jgi:hypothetical protein